MSEDILMQIRDIAQELQASHGYTEQQLRELVMAEQGVPATVFATDKSPLQSLVTYLKDSKKQDFQSIATTLKRSYRAVWGAYSKEGIKVIDCEYYIPLRIFDDKLSIMESVVVYLKEHYELKYSQIAKIVNKNDRTVWTTYKRALSKRD